ncbi:MAG: hypothetical protein ACFFCW_38530 [Candidatus Hodarchaeota archaeon]
MLYVFLILLNDRREIVHFNVTNSPSAFWTGQQIVEAFPWETIPRYLVRDRDKKYGEEFILRVESMGIKGQIDRGAEKHPSPNLHSCIPHPAIDQ